MPDYDRCPSCKCSIILTVSEDERKCFLCGAQWKVSDPAPAEPAAQQPPAQQQQ